VLNTFSGGQLMNDELNSGHLIRRSPMAAKGLCNRELLGGAKEKEQGQIHCKSQCHMTALKTS
jgi:hypothetical protein